jgi:membrane dipeptidase
MLIIDSHLDLAWNALQWNRNLLLDSYTTRVLEKGIPGPGRAQNTVSLPDMARGRVAVCCATLLARCTGTPVPHVDFATPQQTTAIARGQLAYYNAMQRIGSMRLIDNSFDLDAHISEWEKWERRFEQEEQAHELEENTPPPLGCVISMESADAILSPDDLYWWYEAGVRVIGPAHYGPGRYAGGTGTHTGLTDLGRQLLPEMLQSGVILDLSHFSDAAFWEALEIYDGPVLASHNNCRALVPHQRQFEDRQLTAIIEREGVIGVSFDAWMLQPGWIVGHSSNAQVTIATVADHIDHICQLAGNARHAAIGSDLDGGFGRNQSPSDLDTIADIQQLCAILSNRGYKEGDIKAIMYGNWQNLLQYIG